MDDDQLRDMLKSCRVVAVVGLSAKEDRPSHRVALYWKKQGYKIIPVNPGLQEVLGERAYGSLEEIPREVEVDVVDVFRRSEDVPPIARQAIARGAKVLWLREGIVNQLAASMAEEAGLSVIQDRCMLKEHRRLIGSEEDQFLVQGGHGAAPCREKKAANSL